MTDRTDIPRGEGLFVEGAWKIAQLWAALDTAELAARQVYRTAEDITEQQQVREIARSSQLRLGLPKLRPDGLPLRGTAEPSRTCPYPRDCFVLRGSRSVGIDPPLGREPGRAC